MVALAQRSGIFSLSILLLLAVSFFCLIYPVYVIQPFRSQGVRELEVALWVQRVRPYILGFSSIGAILAAIRYFRLRASRWRRLGAATGAALVCVVTGLSRINVYELMFHPLTGPALETAADTKLDADEMVLSIQVNGVARAYPVRGISYHHIVNDVVGGVAVAATY